MKVMVVYFVMAVMILSVGVFAASGDAIEDIKSFVKDKGIDVADENIVEVNFSDLPDEVDIESIENTGIVIYRVDYSEKPLFVISSSNVVSQSKSSVSVPETRMLLYFGYNGSGAGNSFLNMANGVKGSLEKGYVMMREGSVTGISTNLEIVGPVDTGMVEIVIYKNGEEVGFRNTLNAGSSGVEIDYDVQSKGIVSFEAGDVISVYLNSEAGISFADVTTVIEVTN